MELPDIKNAQTQTEGLTLRELQGLDKALQRTRGELTNNLSKLTELDKDITRQKQKLQEAEDETSQRDIKSRIQNLCRRGELYILTRRQLIRLMFIKRVSYKQNETCKTMTNIYISDRDNAKMNILLFDI